MLSASLDPQHTHANIEQIPPIKSAQDWSARSLNMRVYFKNHFQAVACLTLKTAAHTVHRYYYSKNIKSSACAY